MSLRVLDPPYASVRALHYALGALSERGEYGARRQAAGLAGDRAAVLFGPLGVIIYLLLRPPEYLEDVHERELEIQAMRRRLGADQVCPYCRNAADPGFLSCPHCGTKLKNACRRCKAPLDPDWRLCPYCETAVSAPPAPGTGRTMRDPVSQRTTTEA